MSALSHNSMGVIMPLVAADEAALVRAARDDLAQFAPLYDAYAPRIYMFCLRRVGTSQEAEDLTSLIFMRAMTGLSTYHGGSVAAWLFRITRNAVADHYRARRGPAVSLEAIEDVICDSALSPADHAINGDRRATLRALVAALPDSDQELLALKINGELTSQEIGEIVGKRPGAVRAQLRRILKRLRALCPEELA